MIIEIPDKLVKLFKVTTDDINQQKENGRRHEVELKLKEIGVTVEELHRIYNFILRGGNLEDLLK